MSRRLKVPIPKISYAGLFHQFENPLHPARRNELITIGMNEHSRELRSLGIGEPIDESKVFCHLFVSVLSTISQYLSHTVQPFLGNVSVLIKGHHVREYEHLCYRVVEYDITDRSWNDGIFPGILQIIQGRSGIDDSADNLKR